MLSATNHADPTAETSPKFSEMSIHNEYKVLLGLFNSIDHAQSDAAEANKKTEILTILFDLKFKIEFLNLFSLNENLKDLSHSDMKYLSVYCYLGVYLQEAKTSLERENVLLKSKEYFTAFLDLMGAYELLSKDDSKWLQNVLNGIKPKGDAIRMAKIAQYKREKACKEKEMQLKGLLEACGEEDDPHDLEKELVLTTLEILVQTAINNIKDIGDELEMIEFGKKMKSMNAHSSSSSSFSRPKEQQQQDATLDARQAHRITQYSGPMLSKEGKPLRPFVITTEHNKRQQLANSVFQPGHSLPTMTIEEYLDLEMARGNFLSGGTEPPAKKEIGDLDFEAQDAETFKQRDWDEFKDHNPAGWGNRYRKG